MVSFKIWRGCAVSTIEQAISQALAADWSYGDCGGVLEEIGQKVSAVDKHAAMIGRLVSVLCDKNLLVKEDIASILGDEFDVRNIAHGDSE